MSIPKNHYLSEFCRVYGIEPSRLITPDLTADNPLIRANKLLEKIESLALEALKENSCSIELAKKINHQLLEDLAGIPYCEPFGEVISRIRRAMSENLVLKEAFVLAATSHRIKKRNQ